MPATDPHAPPAAPAVAAIDYYRLLRGQLEHEDNLITQRLSWFLASQSFLFTAFAIILNGPMTSRFGDREPMTVFRLIPVTAIALGVLIWLAILAGISAMRRLRALADARSDLSEFPPLHGLALRRRMGLAAPVLLPPIFVAVWCVLLLVG